MKVQELIDALSKAKDKNAEVDIVNENGDYVAESDMILLVDEDEDGEGVHIVVTERIGL